MDKISLLLQNGFGGSLKLPDSPACIGCHEWYGVDMEGVCPQEVHMLEARSSM